MAIKFEKINDGRYSLDVCGLVCPHPQLYAKKSLERIKEGEILEITFDNASSGMTIEQMCDKEGDELLEKREENGKFVFVIEKG